LALLTCLWKRPRLSTMVLEHTARLRVKGVELVPVAVWSPEDPEPADLTVMGIKYVQAPNDPLSDKWNAGALVLRNLDVDAMLVFGSDDFMGPRFIASIVNRLREGAEFVMPQSLYFFDAESKRCIYARAKKVGAGRALSRSALARLSYRPWRSGFNRGIDGCMDKRLQLAGIEAVYVPDIREENGYLVAVKTEENLW